MPRACCSVRLRLPDTSRISLHDTNRTSSKFVGLAVIGLVIWGLAISQHCHHIREHHPGPVILVRIDEDAKPIEVIRVAKHRSGRRPLLGEPYREAVTVEVALTVDLELDFNLLRPLAGAVWAEVYGDRWHEPPSSWQSMVVSRTASPCVRDGLV